MPHPHVYPPLLLLLLRRELRAVLVEKLIPSALVQGGVRLSVAVMSHLCNAVLAGNPQLKQQLLHHIAHMAVFSLFAPQVTSSVAFQRQKCDPMLLLLNRAVLNAFLVQGARWVQGLDTIRV